MTPQEIAESKELFPSIDHWLAFYDLAGKRDTLLETWLTAATNRIRSHFHDNPSEGWSCIPWGATSRDSKWYLEEFGPNSIFIGYGWHYELHLRLSGSEDLSSLKLNDYHLLRAAFNRVDGHMQGGYIFMERRNFSFGLPNDRALNWLEIAWAAGFQEDAFVEQAVAKIERFTKNPEVTNQIHQLNKLYHQTPTNSLMPSI